MLLLSHRVLQEHVEFLLGHDHPVLVRGVHDEDDPLALLVVVLPEGAATTLGHVDGCEAACVAVCGRERDRTRILFNLKRDRK